jgi:hypothetical protein
LRLEGVRVESILVTESAPSTFARLPVREGEYVLVWFGTLLRDEEPGTRRVEEATAVLDPSAAGPPEILELDPTPRSALGQ